MKTALKLGPADQGRRISVEEFAKAPWQNGYRYTLIDGKICVSVLPELPEAFVAEWAYEQLFCYDNAKGVFGHLTRRAWVLIPNDEGASYLSPDLTVYLEYPRDRDYRMLHWTDLNPSLTAEIVCPDDPQRNLRRHAELYLAVPSIKEYWIFDNRDTEESPFLTVHRRRGKRWVISTYRRGETYTTKLLPGFSLPLNPQP